MAQHFAPSSDWDDIDSKPSARAGRGYRQAPGHRSAGGAAPLAGRFSGLPSWGKAFVILAAVFLAMSVFTGIAVCINPSILESRLDDAEAPAASPAPAQQPAQQETVAPATPEGIPIGDGGYILGETDAGIGVLVLKVWTPGMWFDRAFPYVWDYISQHPLDGMDHLDYWAVYPSDSMGDVKYVSFSVPRETIDAIHAGTLPRESFGQGDVYDLYYLSNTNPYGA